MRIIKLDAIDSTNSFLRQLSSTESVEDYTVVVAKHQTKGRGQMGTEWNSQDSKNLTVSVYKDVSFLKLENSFYISMVVSLSLYKTLKSLNTNKLKIKWPNDILADDKKLAGILIENVIKQQRLQSSIIGIGLNVNQTAFGDLPNATSLLMVSGIVFDLDELLQEILKQLEFHFSLLQKGMLNILKQQYESELFRLGKPSTFQNVKDESFSGIILGVTDGGNLKVQIENSTIQEFDLKEIKLLY